MNISKQKGAFALLLYFLASTARACPLCHSSTAEEVRAGILSTAVSSPVLFAIFAPFLLIGLLLFLWNYWVVGGKK